MSGEPKTLTPPWAYYRRTGLSEMRPYVPGEDLTGISVSDPDKDLLAAAAESGENPGGYIARNPENHADQWYVAQAYFDANLEPVGVPVVARDEAAEPRGIGWDDVTEEHVVGAFLDAQAEAHRYRNALEALLNSSHRGIYDAAWALEAVANAEALISPGLDDDYRKAKAQEAYERRLAGGESER